MKKQKVVLVTVTTVELDDTKNNLGFLSLGWWSAPALLTRTRPRQRMNIFISDSSSEDCAVSGPWLVFIPEIILKYFCSCNVILHRILAWVNMQVRVKWFLFLESVLAQHEFTNTNSNICLCSCTKMYFKVSICCKI